LLEEELIEFPTRLANHDVGREIAFFAFDDFDFGVGPNLALVVVDFCAYAVHAAYG
jgi:hypothetical protein